MVGPIPDGERRAAARRLGGGFVGFIAISAGLTAFYSGATPFETGLIGAAGLLGGVTLLVALGVWP